MRAAPPSVKACLEAIERHNRALNAFVAVDGDGARMHGRGALAGIAVAVKDNIDVAGLQASAGMGALRGRRAHGDAPCVARLRAQGAAILGKTNMDEAAFGASGENPWFGRCHNPRRHGFSPGGSSSGSAAAAAAGLCRAALGTDTLGSVRIPAAYCGVVGYLPAQGRIPIDGVLPLSPTLDRVGVLAGTLDDAVRVANAMAETPLEPDARAAMIGHVVGLESFVPPELLAQIQHAAEALNESGHGLVRLDGSTMDWNAARMAALLLIEVEAAKIHAALLDDAASAISAGLRAALDYGRRAGAERLARAMARIEASRRVLAGWFERCDVLLLPTAPQTAFSFDTAPPANQADLCAPASLAGLAAISLPAGTVDGLPVGAQLVARDEARLLGVAAVLERTRR